jgi:hypothetical protein
MFLAESESVLIVPIDSVFEPSRLRESGDGRSAAADDTTSGELKALIVRCLVCDGRIMKHET